MAVCDYCDHEMQDGVSCEKEDIVIDGQAYPQVPYEPSVNRNCHDCKTPNGGFHHPGCDMERCPKCGGQLISCGCLDSEHEAA